MAYDSTKVDNVDTLPAAEYNAFVTEMKSRASVINDLTDVNITGLADNEILKYDNATGKWLNEADLGTTYTGVNPVDVTGTVISVVTAQVIHDSLKSIPANDHIDWTLNQGATNIHAGNYTDTDTTYTGEPTVDITGTVISVVSAQVDHDTLKNFTQTEHFTKADLFDDNITWTGTHQFDSTASFKSSVSVNGLVVDITTLTTTYTATTVDDVLLCNGTFTVTLPSATACVGKIFRVKNIGSGTVTVATNGGTVDGSATEVIYNQYESINIVSDGSNYFLI